MSEQIIDRIDEETFDVSDESLEAAGSIGEGKKPTYQGAEGGCPPL